MNYLEKYKVIEILGYTICDSKTGQIIDQHQYTDEEKAFFDSKMGPKEYEDFCSKQSNSLEETESKST